MDTLTFPQGYGWSYGFWTQREEKEDNEFLLISCLRWRWCTS